MQSASASISSPVDFQTVLFAPEMAPMRRKTPIGSGSKLESSIFLLLGLQGLTIAVLWQYMNIAVEVGSFTCALNVVFLIGYMALIGLVVPTVLFLSGEHIPASQGAERSMLEVSPLGMRWLPQDSTVRALAKLNGELGPVFPWQEVSCLCYKPAGFILSGKKQYGLCDKSLYMPWSRVLFFVASSGGEQPDMFCLPPAVFSPDQRRAILSAIRRWAPHINLEAGICAALLGEPDFAVQGGYTELWLQLLESTGKRSQSDRLVDGERLRDGTYRIIEHLETGGQANVYTAEVAANEQGQTAAEKIILKEYIPFSDAGCWPQIQSLSGFEREAALLSRFSHKNIVQFIDCFVSSGRAYIVMEHVGGLSLRRYVEQFGAMEESAVISIARGVCSALAYLQNSSPPVIHRDLSPENIIIQPADHISSHTGEEAFRLKLIDFSVAAEGESVGSQEVVGKQAYISPEQFRGDSTKQSDLYSLGCVMHFLATGDDPVPISQSQPAKTHGHLSAQFNAIVSRLTALAPQERFRDAGEVAAALDELTFPGSLSAVNSVQPGQ